MDPRRFTPLVLMAAIATTILSAAPVSSASLMCQARASGDTNPLPADITFQALTYGGEQPLSYHWDFQDGATSTEPNPTHTFTQPSIYGVVLTVTDALSSACADTVLVPAGAFIDPLCVSTANTRWGNAPLAVQLDAYPGFVGEPGDSWTWRFGDGDAGAGQQLTHVYDEPGTYYAVATVHTPSANYDCFQTLRITALPSTASVGPQATAELRIESPRPNPFAAMTAVAFEIARPGTVRLMVLDPTGRRVATLVDGYRAAGRHAGVWRGRTDEGSPAPAGIYFARLELGDRTAFTKLVRVR